MNPYAIVIIRDTPLYLPTPQPAGGPHPPAARPSGEAS